LELTGNSGKFSLLTASDVQTSTPTTTTTTTTTTDTTTTTSSSINYDVISISLDRIEEMTSESSTTGGGAITSFSGIEWMVSPEPDCDGSGLPGQQDDCFQVTFDQTFTVDGDVSVNVGMDVFLYESDMAYYDTFSNQSVGISEGNMKFNIRLDGWPSLSNNVIRFLFDIDGTNRSGQFIDYLGSFEQCCGADCSINDMVTISNHNWRKQYVNFPTCDEGMTSIGYDPVVGFRSINNNGDDAGLYIGLAVGGAIALGAVAYMCCRSKSNDSKKEALLG
jgi:hypothetical protein